jgi:hypothetical protein
MNNVVLKEVTQCSLVRAWAFQMNLHPSSHVIGSTAI